MTIRLDLGNVAALNELLGEGDAGKLAPLVPMEATLAGLVELAALARVVTRPDLGAWVDSMAKRWPILGQVRAALRNQLARPVEVADLHAAPAQEVWPLADAQSLIDGQFTLYLLRFERSLRAAGFPPKFATAVVAAFAEMADNVIQHSGNDRFPIAGIAAFQVSAGAMNYVVADLGQGALAKLRATTRWGALDSERDALIAIGRDGATSRPVSQGSGYYHVFESFLNRQGLVRLRSGDGLAEFTGNLSHRHTEGSNTQPLAGFRVFVACAVNGIGRELCCSN